MRSPGLTVEQLDLAIFGDHPDVPAYRAHPDDERPELVPGIVEHMGWVVSTATWPEIDDAKVATRALRAGVVDLPDRLRRSGGPDAVAFLDRLEAFLAEFGSRGPNEWEISAETWETRPQIALAAIDRVRLQADDESPHRRQAEHAATRERVTAEVRALVQPLGEELAAQFAAAIAASHQLASRERTKTNIFRAVHEGRMAFRELGRRHGADGDLAAAAHVFMLLDDELDEFVADPAAWRTTLADRHLRWTALADLERPYFIKDGVVPPLADYLRTGAGGVAPMAVGDVIHGVPGCAGTYRGRARVITDAGDPSDLQPGDVLVAPLTDPERTPLFMAAGAVVVDVGGQISHAIIVCRELGLPCVVSATDATRRIADGALIVVDGDLGTVTLVQGVEP